MDKELERRSHAFCRYADDCNVYVRTRQAGEQVLASLTRFLADRLKLRVNVDKSAVDRPWKRKYPRIRDDVARPSATESRAADSETSQRSYPRRAPSREWPFAVGHDRHPHAEAAGLGELHQAGGSEGRVRGTGRVAAA
nr:hypothetical protein [Desulfolutivibrio sulfoxidireducens]